MGCAVRTECLADALDNRIEFGVWGGMTERERRALLAAPERAVLAAPARDRPRRAPAHRRGDDDRWRSDRRVAGRTLGRRVTARAAWPASRRRRRGRRRSRAARPGRARPAPGPAPGAPGTSGCAPVNRSRHRLLALARPAPGRRAAAAAAAVSACPPPSASASAAASARSADSARGAAVVHPVEHQPGQRHLLRGQPLDEVRRLAQRVPLRRRDHQERRPRRLQQLVRRVGALAEPAEHRVQRRHEGLDVAAAPGRRAPWSARR